MSNDKCYLSAASLPDPQASGREVSLVDFSDIYRDAIRRRRDDELMASAPSGRKWLSFPDLFGSNHLDGQATGEIRWFF